MSLVDDKKAARLSAHQTRKKIDSIAPDETPVRLANQVSKLLAGFAEGSLISGFLSIGDEISTHPSLLNLLSDGFDLCLPVVVRANVPLEFRAWKEGDELENGPLGTRHPLGSMKTVVPDVMLIPLLAYDVSGNRIGWGGGFYDRTLAGYKKQRHRVTAIGVAYDGQEVAHVPVDELDVKMDWIVTEKRTIEITKVGS